MPPVSGGNPADPPESGGVGALPVKRSLPSHLLLIFCCWHAAFLIFSIIPRIPGQNDRGSRPMDLYRLLTGARQVWNMFESIPALHSLDPRLEADDGTEGKITAGPVLPGFKPYPKPEKTRYYIAFHRLRWAADVPPELRRASVVAYRDGYLRKAAELSQAQRGSRAGANWSLVIDAEFTRTLSLIRRDGLMSLRVTNTFAPGGTAGPSP